jgi:hypothetical protein
MKKNTTKIFAAAIMLMATSFTAKDAAAYFRTEKDAAAFYNIHVKDNIDVEIRQSETPGLIIESTEPASELVVTEIINGTLYIYSAENRSSGEKAKVIVMTPEIQSIVMDGSGNVTGSGMIDSDYLKVIVSGTGSIAIDVRVLDIDVQIPGSGKVCLSGNAASSKIRIDGRGNVDAENLNTFSSRVDISGSGFCSVLSNDMNVTISGKGKVVYRNTPAHLEVNVTGNGSVNKI